MANKGILVLTTIFVAVAATTTERAVSDKFIVDTHYGKVQGDTGTSREGKTFYQFKGILYAKAPERFQAPEIPDNWDDIKDATEFGPSCPRFDCVQEKYVGQEEGCLNLNVFTPRLPEEDKDKVLLPVVVVLPGDQHGDFYGPKYMMDTDVVLVTLNNRNGVFGFLNTGTADAKGNMGIRDQIMALKWIKLNIEKFSGDSSRVNLMGFSTGASEAMIHILSPKSKGLFHGAAVHSGNPISPCSFVSDPINQAKKLGIKVGCPVNTSEDLVGCLKGMDAFEILKGVEPNTNIKDMILADDPIKFGVSVEQALEESEDVVVTKNPFELLKEGQIANKVPVILGITSQNGLLPHAAYWLNSTENLKELNDNWNTYLPNLLLYNETAKDPEKLTQQIKEFYFNGKEVNNENKQKLVDLFMDRFFAFPNHYTAIKYAKHAPVFGYIFAHTPKHTIMDLMEMDIGINGPGLFDDVQYFFNMPEDYGTGEITDESDEGELKVSKGIADLWASFMENGKPTKTWGKATKWDKIEDVDDPNFYKIDVETESKVESEDFRERFKFWNQIFKTQLADELISSTESPF